MSTWWINFEGHCEVDGNTPEEAIAKLRSLNPHDGRVYDDELNITLVECIDDE